MSYEDGEALEVDKLLQSTLTISASVTLASGVTAALPKVLKGKIKGRKVGEGYVMFDLTQKLEKYWKKEVGEK